MICTFLVGYQLSKKNQNQRHSHWFKALPLGQPMVQMLLKLMIHQVHQLDMGITG